MCGAGWSLPHSWFAGATAALCGPLVFFDMEVLPASLAASLLTFGIFLLGRRDTGNWTHLMAGFLMGCASLLTPALLLVVLLAGLWRGLGVKASGRIMLLRGALLLVGAAAAIAPVTAHNWAAGDAVLISSNGGVNAFIGNNAQATGAFTLPPGAGLQGTRLAESAREAAEHQEGHSLTPGQVSKHWFRKAVRYALDEPLGWARLLMRKGLLVINYYEIPNHLNFQFVAGRFAGLLGLLLPFWIVFPLAGLGAVVAWSRGGSLARFLAVAGATCLGVPVLFFVTARYRLPALPVLLVLAGGGAAWLVAQVQARAWRWVAGGAGLFTNDF